MHLVIPFAAPWSEEGRGALAGLRLPRLSALLAGALGERDEGDAWSLSPPHERALARAFGWAGADGMLPFAALHAAADGVDPGDLAWGELTPAHWHIGSDQVSMADPAELQLDDAASRALFDAVSELFVTEGFVVHYGAPLRWYVAHEALAELPTASIDRVIGRGVDRWLPPGPAGRLLRRLQNECQMVLHTHPANDEREARGLPGVNSFWLSGCGPFQPCRGDVVLEPRLRTPALAGDQAGWMQAWTAVDAELPARGCSRLTLCGERSGWTVDVQRQGWLQRVARTWKQPDAAAVLEPL